MDAREFKNQLERDPKYQKLMQQKAQELGKKIEEIKIIEQDFIKEIHLIGLLEVNSTGDLLKFKKADSRLVSLLLSWLPKMDNTHGSKEMLVRALAIAEKPFDGRILSELFDEEKSSFYLKWAIGNTIASTKVENITDWLEKKLTGLNLGKEHEMLVYALCTYFDYKKASEMLRKLFGVFPVQVTDALRMIGKESDLEFLEEEAENYNGVGKAAVNRSLKKFIKKLSK